MTAKNSNKIVFVTVGTTCFDDLIRAVSNETTVNILKSLGYCKVVLQIGKGNFEPNTISDKDFSLEYFRYKDSIRQDIEKADLVISHAGSGSVLETLGAKKHMIVVVNDTLMDNHQIELAHQMYKDGHLFYCTSSELGDLLKSMNLCTLKPLKPGKPEVFGSFIDDLMGVGVKKE